MGNKITHSFSWHIYLFAFIITFALFGAGFYLGAHINSFFAEEIGSEIQSLIEHMHSSELLFLLDDDLFCPVYIAEQKNLDEESWSIGSTLEFMEKEKGYTDYELKKRYFQLEVRNYILGLKAKEICNLTTHHILYFYSNIDCSECREQGNELTFLRNEVGRQIRTYSFDGSINVAVVEALEEKYNITSYPSMIIDEEGPYGFMTKEELKEILILEN
ncbi:hypothetical protein KAW38_02860 [Candidatus Micrarchaeota archaeon]|nr:hypothetical protein [Candidatus Micrarchaeota archaeon]